ncbi:hypothetical protein AB8878_06280 [Alphaproteobacteria bacterium LSUCC0226]
MNKTLPSDEIDLIELILRIWNGKLTVISFVIASALSVAGAFVVLPAPDFLATTEIRPAWIIDVDRYRAFNDAELFDQDVKSEDEELDKPDGDRLYKIDREFLLQLFMEHVQDNQLQIELIKKYNIIDRKDFQSEKDFNEAVIEFAASINFLPPVNVDGESRRESRRNWTLSIEYNDKVKWVEFLEDLKTLASEKARETIKRQVSNIVTSAEANRESEIEDLAILIENAFADYDRTTSDHLAFLREQAAIARKLGVSKNTIEAQTFSTQGGLIANIETTTPFYLRGYEAIEKEMELMLSRDDKKPFISGLIKLEQKKRELEQDKKVDRAKKLFDLTPAGSGRDFVAASFVPAATNFKVKGKRPLILALSMVFGGIAGVVYVLIASAIRGRQERGTAVS